MVYEIGGLVLVVVHNLLVQMVRSLRELNVEEHHLVLPVKGLLVVSHILEG